MKRKAMAGKFLVLGMLFFSLAGCLAPAGGPAGPSTSPSPGGGGSGDRVNPALAARLERLMVPLLQVMDRPIPSRQVQVGVVEDTAINAGSAGNGRFIVTTGLLDRADDRHLEGVLAHEIAHDDLGHAASTQNLGAGLNIATVMLDIFFPGSGQFTPVAGDLLIRAYGRNEEYEADRHGADLLRRLHPDGKQRMVDTLVWLQRSSGNHPGGFFSTHPGTSDRIERLQRMP